MEDPFTPNFTSNVGANLVTGIFFLALWFLKNKCKHSRCDTTSACCTCHFDDYDDNTVELEHSKENDEFALEVKDSLQVV